jgi:hypothetical protein
MGSGGIRDSGSGCGPCGSRLVARHLPGYRSAPMPGGESRRRGEAPQEPEWATRRFYVVWLQFDGVDVLTREALHQLSLLRRQDDANGFVVGHRDSSRIPVSAIMAIIWRRTARTVNRLPRARRPGQASPFGSVCPARLNHLGCMCRSVCLSVEVLTPQSRRARFSYGRRAVLCCMCAADSAVRAGRVVRPPAGRRSSCAVR